MYDISAQWAIANAGSAFATRTMCTPESMSRRASFSSPSTSCFHDKSSSSMSRSSDPNLRRLNAFGMLGERSRGLEKNESLSPRIPRPYVPEMKHMIPFILNPAPTAPKHRSTAYNPPIPCLPPECNEIKPKLPAPENRYRELATPQTVATHNAKHPFDATDHVIMKMEFVRPPLDLEELWIESFERWSQIHRKATADQWRWLYENRVLPTETMETVPTNSISVQNRNRGPSPARSLKSSRSLGSIGGSSKQQTKLSPMALSSAARRGYRQAADNRTPDLDKTPTPTLLQSSRSHAVDHNIGYHTENGSLSPLYGSNEDMSLCRVTTRYRHNGEEVSSDDANTDGTENSESNCLRESIDTSVTSAISLKSSRTGLRGESLGDHFTQTESNLSPSEKIESQEEQELSRYFETDSDEEGEKDLASLSSGSSRNSLSSYNEGFVSTPLTAIPARAYSNVQEVQVPRASSQSSSSEINLSLMSNGLRIPRARSVPTFNVHNPPIIPPWTLSPSPMSANHSSNAREYSQDLLVSMSPRTSSLVHSSPPTAPQMRYSIYSSEDSNLTAGGHSLAPSDHTHGDEEGNFATPTQESALQQSHDDLPKVKLDFLTTSPPLQIPSASYIHPTIESESTLPRPPVLPSQIDSFSSEDEAILHDLEKAVCSVPTTLRLSTPCISQIRAISHSKPRSLTPHITNPSSLNNSRRSFLPQQFHRHPPKCHPPSLPTKSPTTATKNPIARLFTSNFSQQTEIKYSKSSKNIFSIKPRGRRNEQDPSPMLSPPQDLPCTVSSTPDLSSFRIIFPSTTDSKRDELYAYLLAYNYLACLPKPISSARAARQKGNGSRNGNLRHPFSSKPDFKKKSIHQGKGRSPHHEDCHYDSDDGYCNSGDASGGGFPKLPTPETLVTEKAAATLGIMSSEESLRTVRLEYLTKGLVERVKEGISRLVAEMDADIHKNPSLALNRGDDKKFARSCGGSGVGSSRCVVGNWGTGREAGTRGRDEDNMVESTLLRTLIEHIGVCEENK